MTGLTEGVWSSWRRVDAPGRVAARRVAEVVEVKAREYSLLDSGFTTGADAFDLFANAWWGTPIVRAPR